MKVERTLIALGLILALAGLVVAMNGYIYVNVDRGPPLVVSGVLVFGFGLVLAALGFILRELQAIAADASKAALLLAKGRIAPAPADQAASSAPPQPQPRPLPPFEPLGSASTAREDSASADKATDETQSDLFASQRSEPKPRPVLPPDEPARAAASASAPPSWMARPGPDATPAPKPPEGDWLGQAIVQEADKARKASAEKLARDGETELEREFGVNDQEKGEKPPQPKPEPIGHYEAHGAHYTMFSDGSIEAETQHGVYRFGSIDELKRFIEGEESGNLGKS
ncbi:hypothetical protein CCR94_13120 [Rhodoblastus sphagnicola]|uniref:DUF308 domain-containing protein n=1 Tax=Rhodoblastus sphagnicola TaxID=333368 RepID=A0A2S6N6P0_9HYPH|nr:hypothetical protein [Rhodoblastus sphagnicola]MBB4197635.1 hypothetical protein [Rhodoblastus sphagnicola]PPQ30257.1 hypothetical protein CCR94_13120 [Rhodoblastus sphagnicola]